MFAIFLLYETELSFLSKIRSSVKSTTKYIFDTIVFVSQCLLLYTNGKEHKNTADQYLLPSKG